MNIRIFLLNNEKNSYARRLAPELAFLFEKQLPAEGGVRSYPSIRDAADDVAAAFSDSHAILFFAEPARYADTKRALAASVGLTLRCDEGLYEKACRLRNSFPGDTSVFAVTHAYVPENGRAIVCDDGLYAGFSVTSGNQTVMVLPLERGRTEVLLEKYVIPQLNSAYLIRADMGALKRYHARRLAAVCEEQELRIAVAGTNTADFFRDYVSSEQILSDRIEYSAKAEKRGSLSPADYVVNLSISAAEFFGTPYGVAISNAYFSGDDPSGEKLIYLAITNEFETSLREVRSIPGEDIPSLLSRCCGDLCTFISDIAGTDADREEVSRANEKSLTSQYKVIIALVAALVLALGVFAGLYFSMYDYSIKTWAAHAWSTVFPGSKPIFTSEPETVSETETTNPEATTKKISLTSATEKTATAAATTAKPASAPATTARPASAGSSSSGSGSSGSGSSGSSGNPTQAPTTAAPTTVAPTTTAPTTAAPTTAAPTTAAPTTSPDVSVTGEAPTTPDNPSPQVTDNEPSGGQEGENTQQSSGSENDNGSGEQEVG